MLLFAFASPASSKRAPSARFQQRRCGAVLIEFAVSVLVLSLILLGLLQYGVYLSVTNSLWNLSREGARFASVQSATSLAYPQNVVDYVKERIPSNTSLKDSKGNDNYIITVTPNNAAALTAGSSVTVRVQFNMKSKAFVAMPGLASVTDTYTTQTTMRVEGN